MSFNIFNAFLSIFVITNLYSLSICYAKIIEQQNNYDATTSTSPPSFSSSPSSNIIKISSVNGFQIVPAPSSAVKRDIKASDLTRSDHINSVAGKNYDPPAEFYRGPGSSAPSPSSSSTSTSSSSSSGSNYHNHRDSATSGFISKPVTFPDTNGRSKYGVGSPTDNNSGNNYLSNAQHNWQQLKGSASNSNSIQDRISVKHYGNPDAGASAYAAVGHSASGYGYEGRPYDSGHYIDYAVPPGGAHYQHTAHGIPAGGGGGYYGHSGEGIPFDVYGHHQHKGHYAGAGGEYSYTFPLEHVHDPAAHKGSNAEFSQKALLAKSFLIPLASAAVLGLAAALVSNPLLLQLGTVSTGIAPTLVGKRRKRRDLSLSTTSLLAEGKVLPKEDSVTSTSATDSMELAYRAHQARV